MDTQELQHKLQEAYSVKNLNNISLTLINLYRAGDYASLQRISELISDYVSVPITNDGKGFSKLIMLYHPDRASWHLKEINRLAGENNFDRLLEYSHILKLERIEEIAVALKSYEDIDYSPVYEWDLEADGFTIINDSEPADILITKTNTKRVGYSFYDAVKIREYGHTDIEYPSIYLEETEEIELSSSDINDLYGVQFCINARIIDVSDNRISDITPLFGLTKLEEMNLSDNQIGYLDGIGNLVNLKSILISGNYIEDLSPLFELPMLEYADLRENRVYVEQINTLIESGVVVDF
ncbi:MAG: leucine-rich repeat domain-containing protein [Bacteroidales bacterium]|nr:leucine-rich repeat domain-containing protein [Bacteroidales bacterium]